MNIDEVTEKLENEFPLTNMVYWEKRKSIMNTIQGTLNNWNDIFDVFQINNKEDMSVDLNPFWQYDEHSSYRGSACKNGIYLIVGNDVLLHYYKTDMKKGKYEHAYIRKDRFTPKTSEADVFITYLKQEKENPKIHKEVNDG